MITIILLGIIYIAFISLGLPDSILGVTWPSMRADFNLELDAIGYVSVIVTVGTVISSLFSGYIIDKLGTGKVVLFSVLLTALALLGFSIAPSFYWFMILAFPLGFGAGSIDTALNNYVAIHYKAHHMNWLHSFWGIGATIGPVIMAITLVGSTWRTGFSTIAIIQFSFFAIILFSLPLWNKVQAINDEESIVETDKNIKMSSVLKIKGVPYALLIFLVYCSIEFSVGLWGSSYLVQTRDLSIDFAARIIAIYYGGITIGRFISGFITIKLSNRHMIYLGISILFFGGILLALPLPNNLVLIPFGIIGLGLAPIFPAMIHETPKNFGKDKSQYVIGYQMAFAYIGSSVFPAVFGLIAAIITISIFPYYIFALSLVLLFLVGLLYKSVLKTN